MMPIRRVFQTSVLQGIYVVEWRKVFNDANVTEWNFWDRFESYADALDKLEYAWGMLEEVGWQSQIFEPLENRSFQYRIYKLTTKLEERNGINYYQDFTECDLDEAFDALLDYNRAQQNKKNSDIYWDLIAAAEQIAEKNLGECR